MARDWFAEAFGAAASDVRAKLIDEAWFGRNMPEPGRDNDQGGAPGAPSAPAEAGFATWLQTYVRTLESERTAPEPDHGIDR